MTIIESIHFILPAGTHIDRAPQKETSDLLDWDSFISTKRAVYVPDDVWYTTGWPPNTNWKTAGGPRFLTFMIPDYKWSLVNCNWGCIILCRSDGTSIGPDMPAQIEAFRNEVWEKLWHYCRRPRSEVVAAWSNHH